MEEVLSAVPLTHACHSDRSQSAIDGAERNLLLSVTPEWPLPEDFSLIRESQIVQIHIIGNLVSIAVHLVIDGQPIPSIC